MAQGGRGEEPGDGQEETPGQCPGWDAIPGELIPSAPHPPTMSISLVRELTRSETEERGSVLRSDSSCGGCPGTGAAFTALPPAGNLEKEKQCLLEERGREPRARQRGASRAPSPSGCRAWAVPMEAASWDAGRTGLRECPGL